MISTTLAILALAAGFDLSVPPTNLKWQTDYAQAMTRASEAHKPMAVVISRGEDAIKKMVAEGTITPEAAKLLTSDYVFVYVDSNTDSGKDLAKSFDMKQGLVISGPGGNVQAYRYTGSVTAATLAQELPRYATASQPTTTISAGEGVVNSPAVWGSQYSFSGSSCPNGNCQRAIPAQYSFPGGCPNGNCQRAIPAQYSFPGSSCPNGMCPNQR